MSQYRKMMMMTMVAMMMMVAMMIWKSLIQGLRAIKCGQNLPSLFWYNDTAKTSQVQLYLKGQLLKIKIKICDLMMLIEKWSFQGPIRAENSLMQEIPVRTYVPHWIADIDMFQNPRIDIDMFQNPLNDVFIMNISIIKRVKKKRKLNVIGCCGGNRVMHGTKNMCSRVDRERFQDTIR